MRNLFTISGFLFFANFLIAQSGEWRVLSGVKISSKWDSNIPYSPTDADVPYVSYQHKSIICNSVSAIYTSKLSPHVDWNLGFHFNNKGFKQLEKHWSEMAVSNLEKNKIQYYSGILMGLRYNCFEKNTWKLSAEVFINPEINIRKYDYLKRIGISSIAQLSIEKHITKQIKLTFNPFFETALIAYNKKQVKLYEEYIPYGYGLMAGIKYNISK